MDMKMGEDYGYDQPKKKPWLYMQGATKYIKEGKCRLDFQAQFEDTKVLVICTLIKDEKSYKGYGLATTSEHEEWTKEPAKYLFELYIVAKERAIIDAVINAFNLFDEFLAPGVEQTHPEIKQLKAQLWLIVKSRRIDAERAIKYITKFEPTPDNLIKLIEFFKSASPEELDSILGGE